MRNDFWRSRHGERIRRLPPDMEDNRHAEAVETLGALNIMVGDAETGLFRPNDAIKRSEVAKDCG